MRRLLASLLALALTIAPLHAQDIINPQNDQSQLTRNKGQLPGTTTNDSACAGCVGALVTGSLVSGSAVLLSSNVPAQVTTISLPAGDWEMEGVVHFTGAATTGVAYLVAIMSATTASGGAIDDSSFSKLVTGGTPTLFTSQTPQTMWSGKTRVSLSGTTSYYLNAQGGFFTSTLSAYGVLRARRVR